MAYFSNGAEGVMWQAENCDRCRNYRERKGDRGGVGCPIWDAHIFFAYEAAGQENKGNPLPRNILAKLIPEEMVTTPQGKYRAAGRCAMFEPAILSLPHPFCDDGAGRCRACGEHQDSEAHRSTTLDKRET